ncbi:WAT1-related protein At3g30340-like [Humulus lupulus]|uniref:WAT1-related protein At3g30340-like n=1 Tax=Humulus lupulus TaxID=3486 RepID=UPI002B414464|nr:WAT1-related protein At3g30340-like [Humulus lupulus]
MGEEVKMSGGCEEWKPFMAMVVVDFAFAVLNILLKKVLDEGMDHLVLVTYRLSISAIFLAPISYFWERDARPKLTVRILCYLFLSAIVGASLTQYLFLIGIQYTSATFACAFVNMVPVTTFLMALPFGLEAVNIKCNSGRAKIVGTLVCIGGGVTLLLYKGVSLFDSNNHTHAAVDRAITKLSSSKKTERWMLGSIALVMGTLSWSSWFLLQSNIGKRYPYQYSSTAIMSFLGAIQSTILSLCTGGNLSVWILKGQLQIITVVFAGMVGSGLGFVTMSWCVKKRGPVFTAAFSPLVQIMAAMIDIPILHERFYLGNLIGSVVVIIGLYILLWGKKKEMQNFADKLAQEAEENKIPEPQLQAITVSSDSRHS